MTTPTRTRPMALATAAIAMTLVIAVLAVVPMALAAGTSQVQPSGLRPGTQPSAIPMPQPVSNPRITLISQTTFVGAGEAFSMVIELADATPDTRFSIALHPAVTSRIQFGQTLGGEQLGTPVQRFDGIALSDLSTDDTGATTISLLVPEPNVVPGPFTLLVTEPGVYPITVTVDDDPTAVPLVTHVVRLGVPVATPNASPVPVPNDPSFSVGVLLNISDSRDLNSLTAALTAHPGVPVTVRAQPERLAALANGGPAGAASVTGLGAAIGDSEVLVDTWIPVDMASLVAARLDQFLDRQLLTGASTLQQLLDTPVSGTTWVMDPSVDPAALAALAKRGVQQVVLPEQLAEPLDSNRFPVTLTRPFAIETDDDDPGLVPAMQTDVVLTSLLTSSGQPALAANRVLADLAVLAFDLSSSGRAAIVDTSGANVPGETIAAVLGGLQDAARSSDTIEPLMQARTIGSLFAAAGAVGEPNGDNTLVRSWTFDGPEPLGTFPDQLANVDASTATLIGTVMPGPLALEANATVESVNRLVLASGQRTLNDDGRTDLLDQARRAIDGALAPIGVPEQGSVTLTANAGVIPVTLRNGRADPVRVRLQLTSDKLDFPNGDTLELVLDPGTNRREVAVEVRASGGFPVEIQLSTPDDSIQLGQGRFTVRSTAISGTGLILSIVAGVFLAGWWAVHFRSARRSRQLVPVTESTPVGQSGPQPPNP